MPRKFRPLRFMVFAYITTLLFATSSVLAARSQQAVGPMRANVGRLVVGTLLLGTWGHAVGLGLGSIAFWWFVWSGVIGMGIGDTAFFAALPRLGTRLTSIVMQCLAIPVAIGVERVWLGTELRAAQFGCIAVILAGIMIALLPTKKDPPKVRVRMSGVCFGALAAAGQGVGAVISRHGFAMAAAAGETLDGLTAAYYRVLGGLVLVLGWFVFKATLEPAAKRLPHPPLRAHAWILIHALTGPVFGMGSLQLALAHTPSGIVLPITACTPLAVIPLAWWFEGERPTPRSIIGGVIAVIGAVALTIA